MPTLAGSLPAPHDLIMIGRKMKGALENSESDSHIELDLPSNSPGGASGPVDAASDLTAPSASSSDLVKGLAEDLTAVPAFSSDQSGTVSFIPLATQDERVDENDPTIISQRPVAAPAEFYRAMPLAELAAMLEGKQLDHFSVEQMIGGGGMGAVFRGLDERLARTVAIKVIPGSKRDADTLRRFRLEAQAAARLDHPNIARVYYIGEAEQWNYIVFEFIDGVNVRDLVTMEGPLTVDDAVYYTRQIAEALQHAHDRGVVHRDVKPSNILVTAGGIAKVVDMGLARSTSIDKSSADATASGITLGTFDYISPEQARDPRDADVRSDLYSLGCSLFYMLTGNPPFPDGTALQKLLNHGSVPPPDPSAWRDDISDQLYEIIMKLMAKQPANRYQRPADLINDLLLLADAEELPKSQTTNGAFLINTALMQRSLLETNLPWMVAFAFLLGSTLWLQSVQAISNGVNWRELPFGNALVAPDASLEREEENSQAVSRLDTVPGLPTTEVQPVPPSEVATNSAQQVDVVVVSEVRPDDVAYESWESSLYRAVRAQADSGGEVEVRGRVVLDRPIYLSNAEVVIQGKPGTGAKLEISASMLSEVSEWGGAIEVDSGSIQLRGLEIAAAATDYFSSSRRVGVFRLTGDSTLGLRDAFLTIQGNSEGSEAVAAILAVERSSETSAAFQPKAYQKISVEVKDTVVRGEATFLGVRANHSMPNRFELNVDNSLMVLGGLVVDLTTDSRRESTIDRNIRILCEQSTFVASGGFMRLDFSRLSEPSICVNRTSNRCVFQSDSTGAHVVAIGGAKRLGLSETNCLLLKGTDNAYDAQLEVFARSYDRTQNLISELRFDDIPRDAWFAERGNERQIPWEQAPPSGVSYSRVDLRDYDIESGVFAPGFRLKAEGSSE